MSYTWCMGGTAFFLFLVETITGLLLMFYYRPTVEYAYFDMVDLREAAAFGCDARAPSVGRPRDGDRGVAPHVPGLHDRLVQTAPRVQLERRRVVLLVLTLLALVHRLPAALGPARDLGDHGRLEHGAGDARS